MDEATRELVEQARKSLPFVSNPKLMLKLINCVETLSNERITLINLCIERCDGLFTSGACIGALQGLRDGDIGDTSEPTL